MKPTDRRLAIVHALEKAKWSRAADLAEQLGVCAHTVYRDMDVLGAAGVPVIGVRGRGFTLPEDWFLEPVRLTHDEAVLVLASTATDAPGLAYQAAAYALREKLHTALPEKKRSDVANVRAYMRLAAANAMDDPVYVEVLALLGRAVDANRAVHIKSQTGEHTVNPYGFVDIRGTRHFLGFDRELCEVRHFSIDTIRTVRLMRATFKRPLAYAQGTASKPETIPVRVRFDPRAAVWVRKAPPAFLEEMEADGAELYATLQVYRETEMLPWLLSWGSHVEVLRPVTLRRRIEKEASRQLECYRPGPSLFG